MTETVCILLPIHNGQDYLSDQLKSIQSQIDVNWRCIVGFDCNCDSSRSLVSRFGATDEKICIIQEDFQFGSPCRSFLRLLEIGLETNAEFFAFCDQDDIWLSNKLSRALDILRQNIFEYYSSDVIAFHKDGSSHLIKKSYSQVKYDHFFESPGPGCSFVFTRKAAEDLLYVFNRYKFSKHITYHDWLLYAQARSQNRKWFIDDQPHLLYRQHSTNHTGASIGLKAKMYRIKKLFTFNFWHQVFLIIDFCGMSRPSFLVTLLCHPLSLRRQNIYSIVVWIAGFVVGFPYLISRGLIKR